MSLVPPRPEFSLSTLCGLTYGSVYYVNDFYWHRICTKTVPRRVAVVIGLVAGLSHYFGQTVYYLRIKRMNTN